MHAQLVDNYLSPVLDLLAPRRCLWCRSRIARGYSCYSCRERLPWNRVACRLCARPLSGPPEPARRCPACTASPPPQDAAWVPFLYELPVSTQIIALKFHASLQSAAVLADLMIEGLAARSDRLPELLVPVPLHSGRLAGRGYNQALELGRHLRDRLTLELVPDAARRRNVTREQTRLSASERRRNVRNVFAVGEAVRGRHVALLDDVITTGATVTELARAARAAGARRIEVWAVARATLSA